MAQVSPRKRTDGIRPLESARDLGQLADLIENAFGEELVDGGERVLRELRWLSKLGPLSSMFMSGGADIDGMFTGLVWEQEGQVVGNVTVNRPTGHLGRWQISNVAVLDTYRRRGIGRKLVEAALDLVVRQGGETAYLFVREGNAVALHLYESLGFVEVDRTTDLKYTPGAASHQAYRLQAWRRLRPGEGQALYELVSRAVGPGHQWLVGVRRGRYVLSADERLARWLGSLFSAETQTYWGAFQGDALYAGLELHATRLWSRNPHRLTMWVHPARRGQVEDVLAQDIEILLSRQARRPAFTSLPACEEQATEALVRQGFRRVRTLILMKLDL
jgi:ribosomal protein S18 acetylase RimI-like enzyme